jgi:hypothetical protein
MLKLTAALPPTAAFLLVFAQAAAAKPPPGGPAGSVGCDQPGGPSCGAEAHRPGNQANGGDDAGGQSGGQGSSNGSAGGGAGCVPQGADNCLTRPGAAADGAGAAAPPAPGALALQARDRFVLPSPIIRSSPKPEDLQLTWLPTWLWVDQSAWRPRSATASVPGLTVTVTATPVSVSWSTGDGGTVSCLGPGTPWRAGIDPMQASPDCGHVYTSTSAGQPHDEFPVRATITWAITWLGGGESGSLPPLTSSAATGFPVAKAPALNVPTGDER